MTSETSTTRTRPSLLPATFASLSLKGPDLDPSDVTNALGVPPTLAYRKGESFVPNTQRRQERYRKFGLWLYSTEQAIDSHDLQDHLDPITVLLSPASGLKRLLDEIRLQLAVEIFWFGPAGQSYPVVPASFLQLVEGAGGKLGLDFGDEGEHDGHRAA